MIKLLRVDHRLLHGQVAVSWFNSLDVNTILIANDAVAQDDFRKSAIRLDKYKMLIVVESVEDADRLIRGSKEKITALNVGGTKPREGTINYSKAVNLTSEEAEKLAALEHDGVNVYLQQVPNETAEKFSKK
jgi:fructoselysine and glucoselysine-specific PTS system IIB component